MTGGNGFVGRAIVELLLDQACDVTVFDITLGKHDPRVKRLVGNLGSKVKEEKKQEAGWGGWMGGKEAQ